MTTVLCRIAAAALGLALLPATAAAQSNVRPVDETAADLAYGLCPLFLAGQLTLDDPQVSDRGFSDQIETIPDEGLGDFQAVKANLADGDVLFGGANGNRCVVTVRNTTADRLAAVWATLHKNMAYSGLPYKLDPKSSGEEGSDKVETWRADLGTGQFLYLALVSSGGRIPLVSAQLFLRDE
ncbi:hypothetical protein ACFQ1E_10085 [Sphingomonas canadensis]|uniref:Uncharacterized protein n=1 Tax=Sphingomonas canadensis TaxID=1219257 RepID=A0ABW3HB60_9SPHN|nr:hypothetical protein [Sphingomonas canadensis]MCW3836532.1 hypothetical protein [Sphingomonas canadensis]